MLLYLLSDETLIPKQSFLLPNSHSIERLCATINIDTCLRSSQVLFISIDPFHESITVMPLDTSYTLLYTTVTDILTSHRTYHFSNKIMCEIECKTNKYGSKHFCIISEFHWLYTTVNDIVTCHRTYHLSNKIIVRIRVQTKQILLFFVVRIYHIFILCTTTILSQFYSIFYSFLFHLLPSRLAHLFIIVSCIIHVYSTIFYWTIIAGLSEHLWYTFKCFTVSEIPYSNIQI